MKTIYASLLVVAIARLQWVFKNAGNDAIFVDERTFYLLCI